MLPATLHPLIASPRLVEPKLLLLRSMKNKQSLGSSLPREKKRAHEKVYDWLDSFLGFSCQNLDVVWNSFKHVFKK